MAITSEIVPDMASTFGESGCFRRVDCRLAASANSASESSEPLLLNAFYLEVLGEIRFVQRRYHESVAVFEQVLDMNPNYARARRWVAAAPDDDHAHSSFPSAS